MTFMLDFFLKTCYIAGMNDKLKKIILLLGDIGVLYLSLYITLIIRYQSLPNVQTWQSHITPFSIIFFVWIVVFFIANLYNLHLAVNNSKFIVTSIRSMLVAGLLSVVFFYTNPNLPITPKTNLIILIISILFFLLWRRAFNWVLGAYLPKNKIAFIGYNEQIKELIKIFNEKPHLGYIPSLVISKNKIDEKIFHEKNTYKLSKLIKEKNINTVILADDPHQSHAIRSSLFSCLHLNINLFSLPNFYEVITGKIPLDAINQMWFLENLNKGTKTFFNIFKRVSDIALALIILFLTLPFWLIIIIIIKYESPGSIFYFSRRSGKNKKIFNLIKFRTMRENGNNHAYTKKNDPRITKFGVFMRKTRIDEIPQVINILRGEISFVGPRPERPELIINLEKEIPFYNERMLVKPGLSGWAQIAEYHSPTVEDTIKKLQYDLFYVKNKSIYLDLVIMLKTILMIAKGGGR